MRITIITDEQLKEELTSLGIGEGHEITWKNDISGLAKTDVCIDLLFDNDRGRIGILKNAAATLTVLNAPAFLLKDLPENFARVNAWPTLLKKELVEIVIRNEHYEIAESVFLSFGKRLERVPDCKGFITARVISMIINEAWFALEENVSTKEEIDLAMKLGTNYPYGPFEWGEKIGLKKITSLLDSLSVDNPRYTPAGLLKNQTMAL